MLNPEIKLAGTNFSIRNKKPSFRACTDHLDNFCQPNKDYSFYKQANIRKNDEPEKARIYKKEIPGIKFIHLIMMDSSGNKTGSFRCDVADEYFLKEKGFSDNVLKKEHYKDGCIWGGFIHNPYSKHIKERQNRQTVYKDVATELLKSIVILSKEKGFNGRIALESSHAADLYEKFGLKKDYDARENNLYYLPASKAKEPDLT